MTLIGLTIVTLVMLIAMLLMKKQFTRIVLRLLVNAICKDKNAATDLKDGYTLKISVYPPRIKIATAIKVVNGRFVRIPAATAEPDAEIIFKSLHGAVPLFFGRLTARKAFLEGRIVLKGHYAEMVSLIDVIEDASRRVLRRFFLRPKNVSKYYEFVTNKDKTVSHLGSRELIGEKLEKLGITKPMFISDPTLKKLGITDKLDFVACYEYFDTPTDSPIEVVEELARNYLDKGCDGIVALGGGSVMDTAKATKLLLVSGANSLIDLIGVEAAKKNNHIPLIALPTTAATGSEATKVAVIKSGDEKLEFVSSLMLPEAVLLDGELLLSLPKKFIVSGAFDAIAHASEAKISGQKNPFSDVMADKALELLKGNLDSALAGEPQAIQNLLTGANYAGHAFSNAMVGVTHAIAHALGGGAGLPHDRAVALILPYALHFCGCSKEADEVFDMWQGYAETYDLPKCLNEAGVAEEQLDKIVAHAKHDGAILTNAKKVTEQDIRDILEASLGKELAKGDEA